MERKREFLYAGRGFRTTEDPRRAARNAVSSQKLSLAKSNIPEFRDGAHIYERFVKPTVVDLHKVGAHYAISSVFNSYPEEARIYCYTVSRRISGRPTPAS